VSAAETDKRIYFPGLNALRFFAAISVVFIHIEQWKGLNGLTSNAPETRFFLAQLGLTGPDAVTFFFVISGFLITYLLLAELDRTGTIAIKKFYMRRILRIWPVYYLVVLLAFAFVPAVVQITGFDGYYTSIRHDFVEKLLLFLFFLPNIAAIRGFQPVGASHLWTVGFEEQFYLVWPLLLRHFRKTILPFLVGVILFKIPVALLFYFHFALRQYAPVKPEGFDLLLIYLMQFRIEAMAIGGLAAWLVFNNKQRILSVIFHPITEKFILAIMLIHILFLPSGLQEATVLEQEIVNYEVYILYALVILTVSCNPNGILKLENRVLDYLGRLSYSIYAYHVVIIFLVYVAIEWSGITFHNTFVENLILYTIVILLTLGASAVSYRWYESVFLSLKSRFAVVHSTPTIHETESQPAGGLAAIIAHRLHWK
jgi:peptidoglycan/LPS O-acetylase OafA/YrhL